MITVAIQAVQPLCNRRVTWVPFRISNYEISELVLKKDSTIRSILGISCTITFHALTFHSTVGGVERGGFSFFYYVNARRGPCVPTYNNACN